MVPRSPLGAAPPLGAALCLASCAAALCLASCGGDGSATAMRAAAMGPAATRPAPARATTARPTAPRPARAAAPRVSKPRPLALSRAGYPVLWVRPGHRVALRTAPSGRLVRTVGARTSFGSPMALSVVRSTRHWAGVTTPYLANGRLAWVRLDHHDLEARSTRLAIVVDVSSRLAELVHGRRTVLRPFAVTVGAPGSTTPLGRYAVTDTFRGHGLNPAYGCCALALTARQPTLPSGWLGGSRIAIHGTYGQVGYALSHGCIRATNADVAALVRRVPVGTPVFIEA